MVEYVCFRCGYNGKQKINLIRHLNRKNVCKATEDDVEIEMIKDYYRDNLIQGERSKKWIRWRYSSNR